MMMMVLISEARQLHTRTSSVRKCFHRPDHSRQALD